MILPPLSDLLAAEQKRHHDEVSKIAKFHAFMESFRGELDGRKCVLDGIGDCIARFKFEDGSTYFYDAENPTPISNVGHLITGE